MGNEPLLSWLTQALETQALPHALLILGEPGCGKNKLAQLLAAALFGDNHALVSRGAHPDYIVLAGEGKSGNISVESVRDMSFELRHSPVMAERRVVHVKEAADLNASSAAALLKTLEEPPDGAFFILTAGSAGELIDTILSRCVRVFVEPISNGDCRAEALRRQSGADEPTVTFLTDFYGGRLGLVLAALRDAFYLDCARDAQSFIKALLAKDKFAALALADRYCEKPAGNLKVFLQNAALAAQTALYAGAAPDGVDEIARAIDSHIGKIDRNVNARLLATSLVASAAGAGFAFEID